MEIFNAIILGIIEGLTEFLPVSSTGHLIIAGKWFTLGDAGFDAVFNVVIQFGAILAVVFYFRKEISPFKVSRKTAGDTTADTDEIREEREHNRVKRVFALWKLIIIGFLPAAVFGVLLNDILEKYLFNPISVSVALIVGALLIFYAEWRNKGKKSVVEEPGQITVKTALVVGFFQCLAMWPGMSRSASTIIGALFCRFSRPMAAEFSFLLGIPTIMGASFYKLLKSGFSFSSEQWVILGIGTVASFIVALFVVKFFMHYLKKYTLRPFAVYRIILGVAVLFFSFVS